jgi:hypothetical protein
MIFLTPFVELLHLYKYLTKDLSMFSFQLIRNTLYQNFLVFCFYCLKVYFITVFQINYPFNLSFLSFFIFLIIFNCLFVFFLFPSLCFTRHFRRCKFLKGIKSCRLSCCNRLVFFKVQLMSIIQKFYLFRSGLSFSMIFQVSISCRRVGTKEL